jgi:hypothetical protein
VNNGVRLTTLISALLGAGAMSSMQIASATPLLIDFTDASWSGVSGQGSFGQTYGSLNVTVTSSGQSLTFNGGTASGGPATMALDGDGLGIGDDEVGPNGDEQLQVLFSAPVTVLGYYFLDLFGGEGPDGEGEGTRVDFQTLGLGPTFADVGTAMDGVGFYGREGLSIGDTVGISFMAGTWENGLRMSDRFSDFAIAGLLIDDSAVTVPEPGTTWLLLAGLGGLVVARGRGRRGKSRSA